MPELISQSTTPTLPPLVYSKPASLPPPTPPPTLPPIPPTIEPDDWERFGLFRETALIYVSEPEFNAALRKAGEFFYAMLLESYHDWPAWQESSTRTELRALVADLRHAQGFAAHVGQERLLSSLSPEDAKLSKHAAGVARLLKQVADTIERKLARGPVGA